MFAAIRDDVIDMMDWLSKVRRELHRYPELKYEERRTSERLGKWLEDSGINVKRGIAQTGLVGLLKGDGTGPVLAMRAEMDALPVHEVEGRPYRSQNPGKMHACGHDAHMAMVLGAARYFSRKASKLRGSIKFIFQPAEEGGAGALAMAKEGVLEDPRVDRLVALHVWPLLPTGYIGVPSGPSLAAADLLTVKMRGKGGHSAYPHRTRDPIVAASSFVLNLQTVISRRTDPLDSLVVSISRFHSGDAFNVTPEEAELWGTIRTLNPQVRKEVPNQIEELAKGIGSALGVEVEAQIIKGYPILVNNPQVAAYAKEVAIGLVGEDRFVEPQPSMGAEDFAFFLEMRPGVFVRLGCGSEDPERSPELHSPSFDIDERILPLGVEFLVRFAEGYVGVH